LDCQSRLAIHCSLDDIGREQIETENSGYVGVVDPFGFGELINSRVGTVFELFLPSVGPRQRKQTTLWSIPSSGQDTDTIHGTQKPVECMRRPMLNNSKSGDAAYEPFLGSGTTLIAAESIGRICLAIEIDPLYVDVAVRRWQAFTGRQATLVDGKRTFDAVGADRLNQAKSSKRAEPKSRRGSSKSAKGG